MNLIALRERLILEEGKKNEVYNDTKHIPTIGVGFNLTRKDASELLSRRGYDIFAVLAGQRIDDETVLSLLDTTILEAVDATELLVPKLHSLPERAQQVLVDMMFNMGPGTLKQFKTMLRAVDRGDYEAAADAMLDSLWAKQVGARATTLAKMMRDAEEG